MAKIFLSHKSEDAAAAEELKRVLTRRSGDLDIFVSETILAGDDWGRRIREELREADFLLLLFTKPSREWDWPLFEAGLYTPLREDNQRRVICLHPADGTPPRPLENLQAIPVNVPTDLNSEAAIEAAISANRTRLRDSFLKPLYRTGELTRGTIINANLEDRDLDDIGLEIAKLFSPANVDRVHHARRILLTYPPDVELLPDDIPDEALVHMDGGDLRPFGLVGEDCCWGDVRESLVESQQDHWVDELARAVWEAAGNRAVYPNTGTFRGDNNGKIYRPVLYRVDWSSERPFRFIVLLSEQPSPDYVGGPGRAGIVFNLIRLGTRFRWEVVEPFLKRIERVRPEESTEGYTRLRRALQLIESESAALGVRDEETVLDVFEGDDKHAVVEMFTEWGALRETLDRALEQDDRPEVKETLLRMRSITQRFVAIAAGRYASLVAV